MESKGFFIVFFLIVISLTATFLYLKIEEQSLPLNSTYTFGTDEFTERGHTLQFAPSDVERFSAPLSQGVTTNAYPQITQTDIFFKQDVISSLRSLPFVFYIGVIFILFGTCLVAYSIFFFF